jgi:cytochrome b involved in lipid metabolism
VVGDTVYNLSGYAADHPGGASDITALCGMDATAAFSSQHGFGGVPANVLAAMAIGKIEPGASLPPTTVVYGDDESDDDERDED